MTVYVIVEHNSESINPSFFNSLIAAHKLSDEVCAIALGYNCESIYQKIAETYGITQVLTHDHPSYAQPLAEYYAASIAQIITKDDHLLVAATTFGKNLMPRIAALLNTPQVSDVIEIKQKRTFRHPIYAGNAIETVEFPESYPVCLTIRPTAFAISDLAQQKPAPIKTLDLIVTTQHVEFVSKETHGSDHPNLTTAKIVISGGRGLQNKQGFLRIEKIASRLGAAVGATRAAVDSGLAPNDWQIGQTGQIVAPSIYFALGISGAIQHLAGMKDSRVIVAINKDPDAPIFQIASYGLIGDLNDLLSQWEQVLTEMGY